MSIRRQAQRDQLAALGREAAEIVKTHTIKEAMELFPRMSRATFYRALRLAVDAQAKELSDLSRANGDPLLL